MYNAFFDFVERPFKLVPNPEFLFLGKSHEEALAHLTYSTSQGDGFVEITGEIGTGKTTLCRVFLEDLDKDIEAAFIFNSKLDSVQLLKAILRELGIACFSSDPAELTLTLSEFLLEKKVRGKSVILLIDEAQNLGRETLEQLRLLSNLETTRSKLLQIILVGQPELGEILDSYEMRQLRQRINLNCHILPMTRKETRDYIQHRINVASRKPRTLFTRAALNHIYDYSRGIPRLINIACDRSLLACYSLNQKKVTAAMVKIAVRELVPRKSVQTRYESFIEKRSTAVFSIIIAAVFFLVVFKGIPSRWIPEIKFKNSTAKTINAPEAIPKLLKPVDGVKTHLVLKKTAPPSNPVFFSVPLIGKADLKKNLSSINQTATRENVFSHVVSLWDNQSLIRFNPLIKQIESDLNFFNIAATQNNLQVLHLEGTIDLVEKYNLPAILGFASPDDSVKGYIAVVEITTDNEYVIFPGNDERRVRIRADDLLPFLTGDIYIPWKDNFGYAGIISITSSKTSIVALKLFLGQIGFSSVDLTPVYNDPVKEAVKQIQAKYGLVEDGIVGPLTKIMMYSEKMESSIPYLDKTRFKRVLLKGT
ncbi:ExeA family protein [Desulfobacula phenolica]|uniref:General secretion pathway protein A n=1 Tax=Desulfobacula phenolica TaxID=90732 RepID=A0A1H2EKF2_9BACT|nr:ExeA family protein [Desulfobacula phenolica]SDT95443.1 general secretion pathway protein A [Desulfobacula phenolica]